MINRREFLGMTAGAGAALALGPELLRAHQQSTATLRSVHQQDRPATGAFVLSLSRGSHRLPRRRASQPKPTITGTVRTVMVFTNSAAWSIAGTSGGGNPTPSS